MELGSFHHVAMIVTDYDRTKEFYVNKLGFAVLGEYHYPSGVRRMDCQLSDTRLEIFQYPQLLGAVPDDPNLGWRHLAFRVRDIEKTVAQLEALGIQTDDIREDTMAGGRIAFFHDPDGLTLELHE